MGVYPVSCSGSTSKARASFFMVEGYMLPPRSALEMVFFDTPEASARSIIVQARRRLSSFRVIPSISILYYIPSLAQIRKTGKKVSEIYIKLGKNLVKCARKVRKKRPVLPPRRTRTSQSERRAMSPTAILAHGLTHYQGGGTS